jgi:hypothetical protein
MSLARTARQPELSRNPHLTGRMLVPASLGRSLGVCTSFLDLLDRLPHKLNLLSVEFGGRDILRRCPVQREGLTAFVAIVKIGQHDLSPNMDFFHVWIIR